MRNATTTDTDGSGDAKGRKPKRRVPADPFRTPSPENCDLGFLVHDEALLIHVADHYERRRRLRESVVYDFLTADDESHEAWEKLIAAASENFVAQDWMMPADDLREPGVITGIHDYFPIAETNPELYDKKRRARMTANGQRPWVITVSLNPERHDAEAFLNWVNTRMIPRIVRSARELTQDHFLSSGAGTPSRKRGIRPVLAREQDRAPAITDSRLRERLFALACHLIRRSAEPGETMSASFERYRRALPAGVHDDADAAKFARRVQQVNADSLAEWKARLGGVRLRTAIENRWLRFE